MILPVGKKICKLLKERNTTKEEFANAIGVNVTEVSKWESGKSYPDITLLSGIAEYFAISIDELFNFTKELSSEDILKITKEFEKLFENEGLKKAIDYIERSIKEYPNNDFLEFHGDEIFQMHAEDAKTRNSISKIIIRAIEFSKVASESENIELKNASYMLLSNLYMNIKSFENAEKSLKRIPKVDVNPDRILPTYFMKGKADEAEKLYQINLYLSINSSLASLNGMINVARKERNYERAIQLLEIEKELIKLFHLEDIMMLQYYAFTTLTYADMKRIDKTLDAMEKYVSCINNFDSENYDISTNEFFNKNKTGIHMWESTSDMKNALLEDLKQNPCYDFIRNTQRYNMVISQYNK